MTHFMNGINLFTSDFELFMVRILRSQLHTLQDPDFKQQVRGFVGQESSHSAAHAAYTQALREQGYRFETYLAIVRSVFNLLSERLGLKLCLAVIAGFEHLTAVLAEIGLKYNMLHKAYPEMRSLWEWHAAEELEHKTLAFDVLRSHDDQYWVRILGGLLGVTIVTIASLSAMLILALQDPGFFRWKTLSDAIKLFFTEYKLIPRSLIGFLPYFRKDFHPSQENTYQYAEKVFTTYQSNERADLKGNDTRYLPLFINSTKIITIWLLPIEVIFRLD